MNVKVKNLVYIAMFAAITAVLTLITIPMPSGVPITLQTFAVALCGYMIGALRGTAAIGVYISVGAVGLPVFSGLRGGFSVLTGATGGFIFGFLFFALLSGLGSRFFPKGRNAKTGIIGIAAALALGIAGLFVCHLIGTLQFGFVTGRNFPEAFLVASLPYIPKDIVSVVLAYILARTLRTRLKLIE